MNQLLAYGCLVLLLAGCSSYVDCGSDVDCLKSKAETCSKSRFLLNEGGNSVLTTLRGIDDDNCKVSFKVVEISEEIKNKYPNESPQLKGKTLNCLPPLVQEGNTQNFFFEELAKKINDSCSGNAKDILSEPLSEMIRNELS